MPEIYIVMYSKYSSASTRFLTLLETTTLKDICNTVCVDNANVRKRIMKHEKLRFQEVPCVIRIFPETGYTEIFEGDKAFVLLKNFLPPPSSPVPIIPQSPVVQPQVKPTEPVQMSVLPGPKLPQQMTVKQHIQNINNDSIPSQPPPPPKDEGNIYVPKNPSFEEIDLITSVTVPQSSSPYLQEIEKENMQRGIPEQRSIKSNSNGGGSITLRAQQMQKEREQEMSSSPGIRA